MPKSTTRTKPKRTPPSEIVILAESTEGGLQQFAGEKKIPVEKLKEHLQSFSDALSATLGSIETLAGQFQLREVEVQATFSAEAGFMWITKAGVEGGVTLKFVRS